METDERILFIAVLLTAATFVCFDFIKNIRFYRSYGLSFKEAFNEVLKDFFGLR